MFELNGRNITLDELKTHALSKNMDFEEYMQKMQNAGLKNVSNEKPDVVGEVKKIPGLDIILPGVDKYVAPYLFDFILGTEEIAEGTIDFLFEGAETAMGVSREQQLENKRRRELERPGIFTAIEAVDKLISNKYIDETGRELDVADLARAGEYAYMGELGLQSAMRSAPSTVMSVVNPVFGGAILGVSTAGGKYYEDLKNRPDETTSNILFNSLLAGGSEWGTEFLGGKYLRGLGNIGKGAKEKAFKEYTKGFANKFFSNILGGGFVEAGTEALNAVIQETGNVVFYEDDISKKKYIDHIINATVPAFMMGGKGGVIASGFTQNNKENLYKLAATNKWKQEYFSIGKQIHDTALDLKNANPSQQKELQQELDNLTKARDKKVNELTESFENLTNKEFVQYGKNLDKILKNNNILNDVDMLGKAKFSSTAREKAEKQNIELLQENYNLVGKEYTGTELEVEKIVGEALQASEIIEQRLKKLKGVNREDLDLKILESQEQIDKLIEEGDTDFDERADGIFIGKNKKGKAQIYINKQVASLAGATNVVGHELLHYMISRQFKTDNASMKPLIDELKSYLQENHAEVYGRLQQRIDKYYTNEDGTIKKDALEEYINVFSDLVSKEKIEIKDAKSKGLRNQFDKVLLGFGLKDAKVETAQDLVGFIKNFTENINTQGLLGKLMGTKILDARIESSKLQKIDDTGQQQEVVDKKSITRDLNPAQTTKLVNDLGKQIVDEDGTITNLEEEGGNAYFEVEAKNIYKKIQEQGLLDNLILKQPHKGVDDKAFLDTTYAELFSWFKKYQPERKNPSGLLGHINPQIPNRAKQAYNAITKGQVTAPTVDIGQTTKEGEVKVQVAAETDAATEAFETEDLSITGQAKKKASDAKAAVQKESAFRKAIGIETGSKIYNEVLDGARKALLRAYEAGTPVRNIQRKLRDEANIYLFKPIKNFLGNKEYVSNLKKFREPIMKVMFTSDLVQLERNVPQDERVFTRFVRKLTSKQEVQDAVNQKLLPPEALNIIDKGTAVNLYEKVDVTENELLSFFDIPAFNPITNKRSGKRGTRKDQLAKYMAGALAYDATMEVAQEPAVMQKRQELADLKGEILAQDNLQTLAAEIGRETNVKFSKSNAVSDINAAMDGNGDFNVYSQIKFSRSHRDAYEKRLIKKRPDLTREQVDKAVQNIFKFVEGKNIPNNKKSKYEKLAMHYTANGYLILPEDGYKVIEAERIADQKKLDPFSFKNPNVLIETYVGEVKATRTDPDKVKTFSNKTQYTNGVTVYDVEDSKQGQRDTRKVIDTHFGKKANPWCLCARDTRIDQQYGNFDNRQEAERFADEWKAKGYKVEMFLLEKQGEYEVYADLIGDKKTELNEAWNNWKNYNQEGNGFKIAFHNGRLVSFRDGNDMSWWDRNDSPTDAPIVKGKKTKDGFRPVIQVQPKKPGIEPKILKYEKVVGDNKTGSVIVKNLDGVIISEFNSKNGKLHGKQFEFTEGDFIDIASTSIYENGDRLSDKETRVYKNKKDVVKNVFGRDAIHLDNITSYEITNTYTDYISNLGKETIKAEGTVNQTPNLERYYELQGQKVNIEITLDASKARSIEDIRSGKLQTLKINGEQQDLRLKFSKSAENKVKFSLTTLQEKNKLDSYISKKIEEYKDGNNVIAHDFYSKLQEERARGNDVTTSYDAAYAQVKKQHNIDFMPMQEVEDGVKTYYAKEIRSDAKKYAADFYKSLLKGLSTVEQVGVVAEYLINVGRPIRSSMVDYITTNEQLLEQEVSKIFGKDYKKYFKLTPAGKRGFKVEIKLDSKLQPLGLYQEITAIKSNPSEYAETIDKQANQARTWLYKLLDSGLDKGRIKAVLSLTSYGQRSPIRKLSKLGYYVKGKARDLVLEHEITANDILGKIMDHVDGKINRAELNNFLNDAYVHVLPNKINSLIKKYPGHTSNRNGKGYESMPKVLKYVKSLKLQGKTELLNPKPKDRQTFAKAVKESRSTNNPTKGITVLDFDDTLATTQSLVKFTRPDGTTGTLNAEQYASTYENLLDQGYTFDFSEFNKVVKGKLAPLFNKAIKLQGKFGPKNMFVLTARPPAAQKAIFDFLKANGLNIPLENITGLGNSTAEAKALWVAGKVGEGFNDFYFADDALQNVQAVKNMLDQFDVKSKVQQAKVKFSQSMNNDFNKILEEVTSIESGKRFSEIKGRKRGASKGKFRFFIPPSHEDFVGLLYNFMGKGKRGDQHRNFFEQALVKPLNRAYREIDTAKQAIANDYKSLNKQFPDIKNKLKNKTPDGDFIFEDAVRVYLWNKHGYDIPGLSKTDQTKLSELVMEDTQLQSYAETLNVISKQDTYVDPGKGWEGGNIQTDLIDATGKVGRAEYFKQFNENADILFSEENLNKIEAGYGADFRSALEDMLHRIKTGVNRPKGQSGTVNSLMNYLNGSVGTVMFFNVRSAILQQMSIVNYINFADNNLFAAAKAFANQKQYWNDFAFIFNSDMLKQRRGGIGTDINGADLAQAVAGSKNPTKIVISRLLKLGFLPTQIGDNIAIATGGATFYRNRVNKYKKDGMSQKEAEAAAFTDFQDLTQSTQQSSRPDMTSQQQASWIGKLILNFQNITSQYNRIIKKAALDIGKGRISPPYTSKAQSNLGNLSKILYYGGIQNVLFYSLQTALFAVMFDDDKDEDQILKKRERVIQGTIDSILRGSGIYGAAASTLKNMIIKFREQREKGYNKDESAVLMELLNFSPVVGIKSRMVVNAEKTINYNENVISEMETFDSDNPQWSAVTNYTQALTNFPANRLYQKSINMRNALDKDYTNFQRIMFFSGYTTWSLGLGDNEAIIEAKEKAKINKQNKKKSKKKKKTLGKQKMGKSM